MGLFFPLPSFLRKDEIIMEFQMIKWWTLTSAQCSEITIIIETQIYFISFIIPQFRKINGKWCCILKTITAWWTRWYHYFSKKFTYHKVAGKETDEQDSGKDEPHHGNSVENLLLCIQCTGEGVVIILVHDFHKTDPDQLKYPKKFFFRKIWPSSSRSEPFTTILLRL